MMMMMAMTVQELLAPQLMVRKDSAIKDALHNAHLAKGAGQKTDQLQCGKCRNWDACFTQAQTRSADEPMTTFVCCNVCGNRWKFC